MKPLLRVQDVARLLNISPGSVYRGALRKEIPSLMVGGARRFDEDDIEAWLADKKHDADGKA